jgi:hypothetical protein
MPQIVYTQTEVDALLAPLRASIARLEDPPPPDPTPAPTPTPVPTPAPTSVPVPTYPAGTVKPRITIPSLTIGTLATRIEGSVPGYQPTQGRWYIVGSTAEIGGQETQPTAMVPAGGSIYYVSTWESAGKPSLTVASDPVGPFVSVVVLTGNAGVVPSGLVTRVGAEMMRRGQPWLPRGVNAQTLTNGDSMANVEKLFKIFPAGAIFRVFFFSNPRSPMKLDTLRAVQQLALRYDHVLMIALSNGAYSVDSTDAWRDGIKNEAWYNGGWKAQLLPHFDRTVKPLASATNVIWQNMNELGQAGGHGLDVAKAREVQHAMCSEIKSRAPNHLVFGGIQDAYPDRGWIKTAADYAEVHNSPACDGTTFHEYESKIPYRVYGVASRFAGFKTALNAIGKILIVGEYGVGDGDTQTTTAAVRVDRARIKSVAYRNAGAVSLYWAVAEPWSTAEPTKGDGAWERVDSPVVAAIATV